MGRSIVENKPKIKMIRNQYNSGDTTHRGNPLQYTCPANKMAKINFNSCSTLRNNDSYVTYCAWQLMALKTNSGQKFWSNFAIGYHYYSGNQSAQIITFRPWWLFTEGQPSTAVRTGNYNMVRSGLSTGRFLTGTFSGSNNNLNAAVSNDIGGNPNEASTTNPWASGFNEPGAICDAQKDYIVPAGTQIYAAYYVSTNGGVQGTGNQIDFTFTVEEMDDYA